MKREPRKRQSVGSSKATANHKIKSKASVRTVIIEIRIAETATTEIGAIVQMTVAIIVVKMAAAMVRIIMDLTVKTANSLKDQRLTLRPEQQL